MIKQIGLLFLLSSILISGIEKVADPIGQKDLLRENITSTTKKIKSEFGIEFDDSFIIQNLSVMVYAMATIEIALSLFVLFIHTSVMPIVLSVYVMIYSSIYYNPSVIPKINKVKIDYCERMFFFNMLI